MAVIIPSDVLSGAGIREGDVLKLAIPIVLSRRRRVWNKVAGIDTGMPAFSREKHDRADDW